MLSVVGFPSALIGVPLVFFGDDWVSFGFSSVRAGQPNRLHSFLELSDF